MKENYTFLLQQGSPPKSYKKLTGQDKAELMRLNTKDIMLEDTALGRKEQNSRKMLKETLR